ncbi:baseplate assembly protein [Castellaniella sp. S9]|uniref:baseplate assembly protein n=1 Tax=Castellaniella sp. S9 TaxID=2993652 RepID=UPI0022B5BD2F|nr:baseplate J/gp47 family protein [Castellaniella sp. S9]
MSIDLSQLPAPDVVEPLDFETILATVKANALEVAPELADVLALESEPATKLCEVFAYRELLLRARINNAARAVMLAYATGADLDNLVAILNLTRLDGESDDRLRARAPLSLEGLSTAGPILSYVYHAMATSTDVADVFVDSPSPGDVRAVVLAHPSDDHPQGQPSSALLAQVQTALSADDVRPLCDNVTTVPAQIVTYQVQAALICLPGPETQATLAAARAACEKYVSSQFRLGYDITVSGLHAALHQPGVMRVDLSQPVADVSISRDQAAFCLGVDVQYGGVDV